VNDLAEREMLRGALAEVVQNKITGRQCCPPGELAEASDLIPHIIFPSKMVRSQGIALQQ
jgi:hypothetical protein